jgi:anaerobic carbon-monoxide dehydrogenase iron sulfur subunit
MNGVFCVTVERCIGCGKCELACAFTHASGGVPGRSRIHVLRRGADRGTPLTCLQCHDAACVRICPAGALTRQPATGAIGLADARCIRCGMCVAACPFGNMIPEAGHTVAKCDLCGGEPRCVAFCPSAALEIVS